MAPIAVGLCPVKLIAQISVTGFRAKRNPMSLAQCPVTAGGGCVPGEGEQQLQSPHSAASSLHLWETSLDPTGEAGRKWEKEKRKLVRQQMLLPELLAEETPHSLARTFTADSNDAGRERAHDVVSRVM